jgi:hypothetical protein
MQPDFQMMPVELRELSRWVVWKGAKIPYCVSAINRLASVTDPRTWSSFEHAEMAYVEGGYSGVGFVLNGDGIVGVDLDKCAPDGVPSTDALNLLSHLGCQYIELSPSGTGLRGFGYGDDIKGRRGVLDGLNVELYSSARYLTVTGRVLKNGPLVRLTIQHYNYQQLALNAVPSTASENDLIRYLDGAVQQEDLLPDVTLAYVSGVVHHLLGTRGFSLTALERDKVRLANAIVAQITDSRNQADQAQFTLSFEAMRNSATLDASHQFSFSFSPAAYPARNVYEGAWTFSKHYYPVIHDLRWKTDSGKTTEEFDCARAIDEHPLVTRWIRNIEKQEKFSFWLPLATGRFYPDFVAHLTDGRMLVVEYKGAQLHEPLKRDVGMLWQKTSGGNSSTIHILRNACAG